MENLYYKEKTCPSRAIIHYSSTKKLGTKLGSIKQMTCATATRCTVLTIYCEEFGS